MIFNSNDFYINSLQRVHYIDTNIYTNNFVEYRTQLLFDELIFFYQTEATIYFDKSVFNISHGDILFLPAGEHEKYRIDFNKKGSFIDIFFTTNYSGKYQQQLFKTMFGNSMYHDFNQILSTWQKNQSGTYTKCLSIIYNIISNLQTNIYTTSDQFKIIQPAVDLIAETLTNRKITVEDLAVQCGISYSYFLKLFQSIFHDTPKSYIIKQKINYSCELLSQGKKITEVSEELGFSDIYFFSRQFKKFMKVSPSEFKNKMQQNNNWFNHVNDFEKS